MLFNRRSVALSLSVGLACLRRISLERIRRRLELGMSVEEAVKSLRRTGPTLPIPGQPQVADLQSAIPCSLLVLSLMMLALRTRTPRARWHMLVRQPGTAACLTTVSVVALHAVGYTSWWSVVAFKQGELFVPGTYDMLDGFGSHTGSAVAHVGSFSLSLAIVRWNATGLKFLESRSVAYGSRKSCYVRFLRG